MGTSDRFNVIQSGRLRNRESARPVWFRCPFYEGNLGKNTMTAPGIATTDTTLTKNFKFGESKTVQFRSEFYNLFNRANFGLPAVTVFDRNGKVRSDAGQITSTSTSARQIQFALKLLF